MATNFYQKNKSKQKVLHYPTEIRSRFYQLVSSGNLQEVEAFLEKKDFRKLCDNNVLSETSVQNMRYHFIVTVTMLTHFCIQAGMPEVQAFDIQDNYIQSADQTHRLVDMEALHDEACMGIRTENETAAKTRYFLETYCNLYQLHSPEHPKKAICSGYCRIFTAASQLSFQTLSRANGLFHSQLYPHAKNGGGKKSAALYGLSLPEHCRFACLFLPEPFYSAVPKIHALNTETIPESAVP